MALQAQNTFGEALREARAWHQATIVAVLSGLQNAGYDLSATVYGQIEADEQLPEVPIGFVEAVGGCLGLSAAEKYILLEALAYSQARALAYTLIYCDMEDWAAVCFCALHPR
jgi:hypothetical protein